MRYLVVLIDTINKLRVVEFSIEAVLHEQLLVRTLLHDIPLANNKNYICLSDRTQTMSDNEARSSFERFAHRFLHERFGVRIAEAR